MDVTVIVSETVNADSTIELLETLRQKHHHAREIKVILGNASYHYSNDVQNHLKKPENKTGISTGLFA